jgi:predicted RNA-binding Zn-ribbon protein involved in translation (DUF1610 family)
MDATETRSRDAAPAKAVLFCPECGHSSRFDGEWRVVQRAATDRYLCPDCDTEIAARPGSGTGPSWSAPTLGTPLRTWDISIRLWGRVWSRSMALCLPRQ